MYISIIISYKNVFKNSEKPVCFKTISFDKIIRKFVAKLLFMDILTFLGLNYRVASVIILYFVVPGISIQKIRSIG